MHEHCCTRCGNRIFGAWIPEVDGKYYHDCCLPTVSPPRTRVDFLEGEVSRLNTLIEVHTSMAQDSKRIIEQLDGDLTVARLTVAFFASCIKSEEPWTETNEKYLKAAMGGVPA